MSETFTTYGIGPDKCADELQALRDERDRLREALERVLEQWVNGRKVKDGICMEVLVAAKAALMLAGGAPLDTK